MNGQVQLGRRFGSIPATHCFLDSHPLPPAGSFEEILLPFSSEAVVEFTEQPRLTKPTIVSARSARRVRAADRHR